MLIEELIRLGRPLVEGGLATHEVLRIVTDVGDDRTKNFFRNVLIAELSEAGDSKPAVWRVQLGQELEHKDGRDFHVDKERAVALPFSLPSGGNPLNPQGRYGIPVYPCWGPHLQDFRNSADEVRSFLAGRLERTPGFVLSDSQLERLSCCIHELAQREFPGEEKRLGVLVLVRCSSDGAYHYGSETRNSLGRSRLHPKQFIEPNWAHIADSFWGARLEEGREMGARDQGACSISGNPGQVVSPYCKAWPWAFPTWTCPVGHGGETGLLVEGIALSAKTYRALVMGASLFGRLTRRVRPFIIHEVFSPTSSGPGRRLAQRRGVTDLASVHGTAFLLPIEDRLFDDQEFRETFAQRMLSMLEPDSGNGTLPERQLEAVTGFDCFVPVEFDNGDFRLTLVYFSGDPSRGDIHLRAYIQDVLPSAARRVRERATEVAREATKLFAAAHLAQGQRLYLAQRYRSVPYLLARGFGGSQLWSQLEKTLHRAPLEVGRVTANAAARMAGHVNFLPESRYDLAEEAIFYLCCREFISQCNRGLATAPEEEVMAMRAWQDLIRAYEREPFDKMEFQSPAELGFACGLLIHRFNRWYTRELGKNKDFIRDRILTFGATLTPREVCNGVRAIRDVAFKHDALRRAVELGQLAYFRSKEERKRHIGDYMRRHGVVLGALERQGLQQLSKEHDGFMTGFWAGYSLQGYDPSDTDGSNGVQGHALTREGGTDD